MLVLSRKKSEKILVGDNIVITLVAIRGDKVRIGIEAPQNLPIHREEVAEAYRKSAETVGRNHDPLGVGPAYEEQGI